jgi:hypothetical protein
LDVVVVVVASIASVAVAVKDSRALAAVHDDEFECPAPCAGARAFPRDASADVARIASMSIASHSMTAIAVSPSRAPRNARGECNQHSSRIQRILYKSKAKSKAQLFV